MPNRVVVACRANTRAEWDICYICQEEEHAKYMAQEIKNEEKKLIVGYCDEDRFFSGGKFNMTIVKEGGKLPAPASSVKKFKEDPFYTKYVPPKSFPVETPKPPPPPKPIPQKTEAEPPTPAPVSKPAKRSSELGMFRKDRAKEA